MVAIVRRDDVHRARAHSHRAKVRASASARLVLRSMLLLVLCISAQAMELASSERGTANLADVLRSMMRSNSASDGPEALGQLLGTAVRSMCSTECEVLATATSFVATLGLDLVVPPQGATTECALALFWSIFFVWVHPPDITGSFSPPGSRGCAGTTKSRSGLPFTGLTRKIGRRPGQKKPAVSLYS